jgi:hypothetical protein
VHVLDVEPVAVNAPALVVDLLPLLERLDAHGHVVQAEPAVADLLTGLEGDDAVVAAGLVKELLAVGGDDAVVDALDDRLVLAGVQVIGVELVRGEVGQLAVAQVLHPAVVAGGKGQRHDALVDSVEIDAQRLGLFLGRLGLLFLALGRGRFFRRLGLLDVVLVGEQRRRVLGQGNAVDARGFVVDVVELVIGEGPVEVALGEEIEVAPVQGEGAGEAVVTGIQQRLGLTAVEAADP